MFKSYFTTGWRNLLRNPGYSFINIGGLAIGMTAAILNGLWIWDELSFNTHHDNYDRIAQVSESGVQEGNQFISTTMTYPLGTALTENYGDNFEAISRTSWVVGPILTYGDKKVTSVGLYADAALPQIFTFRMLLGNRDALRSTQSIVISASLARSLFGPDDPLGKVVTINNMMDASVSGVYEDFPLNTKFAEIKFFGSWDLWLNENKWIEQRALTDWRNHFLQIYVQIKEPNTFESTTIKVRHALQFAPEDSAQAKQQGRGLYLYPMKDWHLYPPRRGSMDHEPAKMVKLVGAIGVFILLLACINFMNLSTARSEKRAKEVGIRKTIGSVRAQLISQFFSESLIVVVCAFVMALALSSMVLPTFNEIAVKQISMPWTRVQFWLGSMAFILFTSLVAGSYPALFLSSFNPVKALKGTFHAGRFSSMPRKVLVVLQFSISVILIICTAVVYQQINFAKDRPVGYDRDGLIMIEKRSSDFYGKYNVLQTELKNTGVVEEISESMGAVTQVVSGNNGWDWKGRDPNLDESFVTHAISATHGKTARWHFVAGRDFSPDIESDSSGVIINEAAAKFMGFGNPVGEMISWKWWRDGAVMNYTVIGVVKNLVMDSPYAPVEPSIFYLKGFNGTPNWINIRLRPDVSTNEALGKIEKVFRKIIPSAPFEYKFADQEYAFKFAAEERIGRLATVFAGLAIFISCLGLFGLASFMAEQRTKEIGIRKVLGATVLNVWRMLSRDFIMLVLVACALSFPLAYYFMNQWLEQYTYRIEIPLSTFIVTCIAAVVITLVTVSFQAIKAAVANPVKSLRSE
jgi:putative ABC transport system permease protein